MGAWPSGTRAPREVAGPPRPARAGLALTLVAVSTFLSMSVWFSASFVVPQLKQLWHLSSGESSLLTIAVQLGFAAGALTLAATGIADAITGRRLICCGALGAAVLNLALLWAPGFGVALLLRALTGASLAAVYPPALKEVSSWFRRGRGTALGVMIGALTLGSAAPQLVKASGGVDWHVVIGVTSALAASGALVILLVPGPGPYPFPRSTFRLSAAMEALRHRPVVLADIGYVGHMWELYAMWAWVGAFLAQLGPFADSSGGARHAALAAFVCIGVGALGCLTGGLLSDRFGRAPAAMVSLFLSGSCAVTLACVRLCPFPVVLTVCAIWGFWVIADSAQFSAMVTEKADPSYVGSAVSLQLAAGYLTTSATIFLVPILADHYSWSAALAVLAVGPLVGLVALFLYQRDESARSLPQ